MSYGQTTIKGKVTEALTGQAVIGATVLVKSTGEGTITDIDGNYSIQASEGDVLTFSYVGFGDKTMTVGTSQLIDVQMAEGEFLDEVVVIGYAAQTRGDITGAVESVDMLEAIKAPLVNAAEALQGRVSGVTIINNGNPGAAPTVRIRGFGTTGNNDPLYIIDGVQTTDGSILNAISPSDIEQMNVLKDAAAAIYGSRASNGVVIITTKSGSYNQNEPNVSFNAYTGSATVINTPDLLNTQQHADMIFESFRNDGVPTDHPQYGNGDTPVIPANLAGAPFNVPTNQAGTDWLDEIFRSAPTQNVDFSVSNGNETSKYAFSLGYLNRDGIQLATGFNRGVARINSELKVNDRITVGEHINLSLSNSQFNNGVQVAARSSPLIPVRDGEGNFAGTYASSAGLGNATNPVADLSRGSDNFFRQTRVIGDIFAKVKLVDGLTFKTSIGGDFNGIYDRNFLALNPEHSEARTVNSLQEQNINGFNWVWTNTLNYIKEVNKHTFNVLVGTEALRNRVKGSQIRVEDFLFETPDFYTLTTGAGAPQVLFAFDVENTISSYFGSLNYSFDDKYYLTATLRNDNSSNFLPENTGDIFPSISAGWVVSNENFFNKGGILNYLKLKASWGQLGNQDTGIANNPGISISGLDIATANYPFGGSIATGAILRQVGNSAITWETSETSNIGLELGLLNNDLLFAVEYFRITTKDLIGQDFSLINDLSIDAQAPFVNLGSIVNKGFDFSLSYEKETNSGFSYGFDATLSTYTNEVTELVSAFQVGDAIPFAGSSANRTEVGQPVGSFFGREVDGIYRTEAEVTAGPDQGFENAADGVGRLRYVDQNGDGLINDDDRTFIGSPHPDFVYGINLKGGYKGFDVSAFFNGSQGNEIYNAVRVFTDFPTFFNGNRSTTVLDAFNADTNPNGTQPALSSSVRNSEIAPNSFFVEDGSFFRLKNIQIGYTLPSSLSEKIGIPEARFYVSGSNLWTVTNYSGVDPEISGSGSNPLTIGLDVNNFPISRVLLFGVNLKL
jgi:TonB-linked SusC/RagA family outer membrane protein